MILNDVIYPRIANGENTLLMFDYDGTLTPIADKPTDARLAPEIKLALEKIALDQFIKIAIISGRSIKSLQNVSQIRSRSITMFGLHGGEMLIDGKIFTNTKKTIPKIIKGIENEIKKELKDNKGIILENKGYSLAVHYRLADEIVSEYAKKIVQTKISLLDPGQDLTLQYGKKVVEVIPANFSKDKAVRHLINENPGYYPVYFGDDLTDIAALQEVLNHNGIAIGIGRNDFLSSSEVSEVINIEDLYIFIKLVFFALKH